MLVSTARTDWEEVHDYYGVQMAWNHPAARESLQMVVNTGFEVLSENLVTTGDETATGFWRINLRKVEPDSCHPKTSLFLTS